jgi:hypothetical protein
LKTKKNRIFQKKTEYRISTHPVIDPTVHVIPAVQAALQPVHEVALLQYPTQKPPLHEIELEDGTQLHFTDDEVVVVTDDDDDDDPEFDADTLNPTARPIIRQIARMPNTVVAILQNNALLLHFRASRILFARLFSRV